MAFALVAFAIRANAALIALCITVNNACSPVKQAAIQARSAGWKFITATVVFALLAPALWRIAGR